MAYIKYHQHLFKQQLLTFPVLRKKKKKLLIFFFWSRKTGINNY